MKRKLRDVIAVRQLIAGAKTTGMNPDDAWAIIKCNTQLKKLEEGYNTFHNETIEQFRPVDWEENVGQVMLAEDPSSDMNDDRRNLLIEYRDGFFKPAQEVLSKELDREVDIDVAVTEDALRMLIMANDFDIEKSCDLLTFFQD